MSQTLKVALGVYLLLVGIAFLVLRGSSSQGYELSIYANTPSFVWAVLFIGIVGGIAIIIHQALTGARGNTWLVGFGVLLLVSFTIASLAALRGYLLFCDADPMAHFAFVQDILQTGRVDQNAYPLPHIFVAQLSLIGNISPLGIMKYIPALLTVLDKVSLCLLAALVWKDKRQVLLTVAAAGSFFLVFYHISFYPRGYGSLLLAGAIYLYFRNLQKPSFNYGLLLLFLVFSYCFFHPQWAISLFVLLAVVPATILVRRRITRTPAVVPSTGLAAHSASFTPAITGVVILLAWTTSLLFFQGLVRSVYRVLFYDVSRLIVPKGAAYLQLDGIDIIGFFLKSWGHLAIYGIISLVAIFIILRRVFKGERGHEYAFYLVVWVIAGDIFMLITQVVLYYGRGLTTAIINGELILLISPIFVGFVLAKLLGSKSFRRKIAVTIAVLLLVLPSTLAVFSLYYSPWVYRSAFQVTRMDFRGAEWLVSHRAVGQYFNGLGFPHGLIHMTLSQQELLEHIEIVPHMQRVVYYNEMDIPSHFGYDKGETLGEQSTVARLMIITERFRAGYINPILKAGRVGSTQHGRWDFDTEDLVRLENDYTVSKVYSNGEFDIFRVISPPAHPGVPPQKGVN